MVAFGKNLFLLCLSLCFTARRVVASVKLYRVMERKPSLCRPIARLIPSQCMYVSLNLATVMNISWLSCETRKWCLYIITLALPNGQFLINKRGFVPATTVSHFSHTTISAASCMNSGSYTLLYDLLIPTRTLWSYLFPSSHEGAIYFRIEGNSWLEFCFENFWRWRPTLLPQGSGLVAGIKICEHTLLVLVMTLDKC